VLLLLLLLLLLQLQQSHARCSMMEALLLPRLLLQLQCLQSGARLGVTHHAAQAVSVAAAAAAAATALLQRLTAGRHRFQHDWWFCSSRATQQVNVGRLLVAHLFAKHGMIQVQPQRRGLSVVFCDCGHK
jgi:hypothetical protein